MEADNTLARFKNPFLVKRDANGRYRNLNGKFVDLREQGKRAAEWRRENITEVTKHEVLNKNVPLRAS